MPLQPTFTHVLVSELLPPDPDVRQRDTAEHMEFLKRLGADIQARGLQVPLICYADQNRPRVMDGETRRLSMVLSGYGEPVPILLYPNKPEPSELMIASLQANALRRDHSDFEYASAYQEIMAAKGWTPAELFRQLKINPSTGHKRLAISKNLCPQVQDWVKDGTVGVRAAYSIARLKDHAQQVELAQQYREQAISAEDLEVKVGTILNGGKRVKAVPPISAKCDGVEFTAKPDTTLEILATAAEKLAAIVRKLIKEKKGVEYLPLELRSA
jgi:hypothetical protein